MDKHFLYSHVILETIQSNNKIIFRDGSRFTHDSLKLVGINSFFDHYETFFKNSEFLKTSTAYLICTGCGSLKQLEDYYYDEETIIYLNDNGLDIYLYEDLYVSTGAKVKNYLKGPDLTGNIADYVKKNKAIIQGFETNQHTLESLYSFELESIKLFMENNNLNNVTVFCCDYNVGKYFQSKYPMITIKTKNLYVFNVFQRLILKEKHNFNTSNLITHKFVSANNNYKGFRHLIVAYLLNKSAILSFDRSKAVLGNLENYLWFDLEDWKKRDSKIYIRLLSNLQQLSQLPPMRLEQRNTELPNANFETNFEYAPEDVYSKCFCSIVTETKFSHPVASFSEKTINSIYRFRPFILVAPPHTLEYLKTYGFKTFDKFWDESYDSEENHEYRLIKILKVIDYIDNLSITSLRRLYDSLRPILEHNFEILKKLKAGN